MIIGGEEYHSLKKKDYEWFFSLSPEKMRKMADNDLSNITDAILVQLEPEDLEQLKNFATFWIFVKTQFTRGFEIAHH